MRIPPVWIVSLIGRVTPVPLTLPNPAEGAPVPRFWGPGKKVSVPRSSKVGQVRRPAQETKLKTDH